MDMQYFMGSHPFRANAFSDSLDTDIQERFIQNPRRPQNIIR
jgi:hypothetical protein